MLDRNRLIDPVVLSFVRFEQRVSLCAKRSSDVGHQNFGVYLLLNGVGQFSGGSWFSLILRNVTVLGRATVLSGWADNVRVGVILHALRTLRGSPQCGISATSGKVFLPQAWLAACCGATITNAPRWDGRK